MTCILSTPQKFNISSTVKLRERNAANHNKAAHKNQRSVAERPLLRPG